MKIVSASVFVTLSLFVMGAAMPAQDHALPYIDRAGKHPALIVDGSPYLMLGAQMNNSSAWPETMPAVWKTVTRLGVNTLEAPIYWETFEPTEGHFDFAQVDMLLSQAREHKTHLVLLWFGTWKNGSPGYTPEWIKRDPKRFPLARKTDGTPLFTLSPFGTETLSADRRAFVSLMQHLHRDDTQHTVLMVQVENETGMWGGVRDHSPTADKAFADPVPAVVLQAMQRHGTSGSWSQIFGKNAEEFFSAWAIARYVEQVAEAGRAVYPLPLYVNAALRDPLQPGEPGSFEAGGPTFDVLALWHATAPVIDGIEPDIYLPEPAKYAAVLNQYALPWNAFFVPETGNSSIYAHYFFSTLAHGGFGWSPFGIDATGYSNYPPGAPRIDEGLLAPFVLDYQIAAPMARELASWMRDDLVRGSAEGTTKHTETLALAPVDGHFENWSAQVSYGLPSFWTQEPAPGNEKPEGEALIVSLGPNEFLVTGVQCRVDFKPVQPAGEKLQRMWVAVEEGSYVNGSWKGKRLWNGDQTDYGLNFGRTPQVLRVRLMSY